MDSPLLHLFKFCNQKSLSNEIEIENENENENETENTAQLLGRLK